MEKFLSSARRAGGHGALRRFAEQAWEFFCQLRVAQEWMVRRASQLERWSREARRVARRAASSGASRTFI
ncbi:hypothetical protein A2U01_0057554, partial [Trifolium medium]|nr:hypothetical protein [Trifolium medium]